MSTHDLPVADTLASGSARSAVAEENTLDSGGARGAQVEPGALPERIGRYNVLARLGSGGMGVVFSAHDPDLDRRVAVKLLHTDRGGHDSQIRLLREAQALARLSHRNVVQIHDTGAFGEQVFIAMELIHGVDLHSWLTSATRSADEVLHRFLEAGHGLAAAHDAGLVHRDFKPKSRRPSQTAPQPTDRPHSRRLGRFERVAMFRLAPPCPHAPQVLAKRGQRAGPSEDCRGTAEWTAGTFHHDQCAIRAGSRECVRS